jgi:alpha-mannosidase
MNKRRLGILAILCAASWTMSRPATDTFKPAEHSAQLVGHAHIDLSWLWRWEETVRDIAVNTFGGTLDQMARMKGLTFAQSQAALYEAVEKEYPDLFASIKDRIKEGTWLPVGGMWVEPDLNMVDGEALVRQLLYGKRYFRDKFGVEVKVGWNPDSFGHCAQLPQVLKKAGIDSYVFERCAPDKTPVFWWEGMDGSRVLGYVPPGWYNFELKNGVRETLAEAAATTPVKDFLLLYGEGDHGGGPRANDLEAITRLRRASGQPRLEFANPEKYFQKIVGQGFELPVVKGELNFAFRACYTTQSQAKKDNRRGESLLLTAEKFSSVAAFGKFRDYYPEHDLDEAWKIVLRNQFHDILDGSSIGPVYEDNEAAYREAFERGQRALDFSLETIINDIDTRGEGLPLVVFNPLFWDRTDAVETEAAFPADAAAPGLKVLDAQGNETPCQVLERGARNGAVVFRVLFVAENVPSFGYKVFRVVPAASRTASTSALSVTTGSLENEFLRVSLDPRTGWVTSLFDKRGGREVLAAPGNYLEALTDEPKSMSAWELGLKGRVARVGESGARIEIIEKGPVRVAVRITSAFRESRFTQDLILTRGIPRLDCRLSLDWQERNIMIKAAFPAAAKNSQAFYEIPFGAVARPADGSEVPALRWIDLTDESGLFGVSLLNDCKYGFDVKDNTLRLSVVHGATNPDPEADRGRQELVYSLFPHQGSWQEAGTVQRGYELNTPLLARTAMVHAGPLPAQTSFVRVQAPPGVIVSALKKEYGYYNRGFILRAYETFGKKADASLEMAWPVRAAEASLIDYSLKRVETPGDKIALSFEPYEIKTVKFFHSRNDRP